MTESPGIDITVPHPARVYDYWLGGKDNYRADREAAAEAVEIFPKTVESARSCRAFLSRVVTYLTAEAGIRQFLDLGSGLPSAQNVHEVAQSIAPQSRVVYVDHDPVVLLHARALLRSRPEGATGYIQADLRRPEGILAKAAETLDFSQPVAVMLLAVLHFVTDAQDPARIIREVMDAVAARELPRHRPPHRRHLPGGARVRRPPVRAQPGLPLHPPQQAAGSGPVRRARLRRARGRPDLPVAPGVRSRDR